MLSSFTEAAKQTLHIAALEIHFWCLSTQVSLTPTTSSLSSVTFNQQHFLQLFIIILSFKSTQDERNLTKYFLWILHVIDPDEIWTT